MMMCGTHSQQGAVTAGVSHTVSVQGVSTYNPYYNILLDYLQQVML